MKTIKLLVVLLLLGAGGVGNAWADHYGGGHVRFGVMIGPYWGGPSYYYPPPYYYPPYYPQMVTPTPQVYIEQQAAPAAGPVAEAPSTYWYYCSNAKGYYPYVKECPGGWQRVLPQPPGQP